MPIPGSNEIRQPLLEYLMNEKIPVKLSTIIEEMGKRMNLTKRELEETVPSGGRRFAARVNMLVVKLKRDGLVKPARHSYLEITQEGIEEAQKIIMMSQQEFQSDGSMIVPPSISGDNEEKNLHELLKTYLSNNEVKMEDLPKLARTLRELLSGQKQQSSPPTSPALSPPPTILREPAVPIEESVTEDHIICLECGNKFISLTRHLKLHHGMKPGDYRVKWKLLPDYPMVVKRVSEKRAETARSIGLGGMGQAARKEKSQTA